MTILVCTTASDFFGGKYDRYQDDADLSELPFYDSMCLLDAATDAKGNASIAGVGCRQSSVATKSAGMYYINEDYGMRNSSVPEQKLG
jgi:hypothetical protein